MYENEELTNVDGAQQCLNCGISFKIYTDEENGVNFCPSCGASSDKFIYRPDLEE